MYENLHHTNLDQVTQQPPGLVSRLRRAGPMTAVLIAVGLLALACGAEEPSGPGVADVGSSSSASPSASATGGSKADGLAYSRCMREHGIEDYPDPGSDGQVRITSGEDGPDSEMNPKNPTFRAAQEACKALRVGPGTQDREKRREEGLAYAKCMREHGVKKFPDPKADGGIVIEGDGIDPNSQTYKDAKKACADKMSGRQGGQVRSDGGSGNGGGGQ